MRTSALPVLALVGGFFVAMTPGNVTATIFHYTGASCTIFGCGFNNPSNWSPSGGPPGSGDIATIAIGHLVVLIQDTGSIVNTGFGSMTLRDGANIGVRVNNSSQNEMKIGSPVGAVTAAEYTQSSAATLEMDLGGLVPGIEFDQLTVIGLVNPDGTLDISLHNGFSLSLGDSFEILDIGGTRTGEFIGLTEGALVGNFGEAYSSRTPAETVTMSCYLLKSLNRGLCHCLYLPQSPFLSVESDISLMKNGAVALTALPL